MNPSLSTSWRILVAIAAAMLAAGCLESSTSGGNADASTGGDGDGDAATGDCEYGGMHYDVGDRFDAEDGCNTCVCGDDGSASCTLLGCGGTGQCDYGGTAYDVGERFPSEDGCNSCACGDGGEVGCTTIACAQPGDCTYGGQGYAAGEIFPDLDGCNTCECGQDGNVACTDRACGRDPICELAFDVGPCDAAIPVWWFDAATGQCEQQTYGGCEGNDNRFDTFEACATRCNHATDGVGCRVGGQTYPHGARVPDPYSCNSCFCEQGQVASCTEVACSEPCPANTTPGTSCALCGPGDGCEVLETDCLASCVTDDDCDAEHPQCHAGDGHCAMVCG